VFARQLMLKAEIRYFAADTVPTNQYANHFQLGCHATSVIRTLTASSLADHSRFFGTIK
jgi:hypothetical protein